MLLFIGYNADAIFKYHLIRVSTKILGTFKRNQMTVFFLYVSYKY